MTFLFIIIYIGQLLVPELVPNDHPTAPPIEHHP